jgi:hypothetical protein
MTESACVCVSCGSQNLAKFDATLKLHFPQFNGLERFSFSTFLKFVVCLDCGIANSNLSATELELLREGLVGRKHHQA